MRLRLLCPILPVIAVAACVAPPRQPPAPTAPPVAAAPAPPPSPAADWRDRPRDPGDWRYVADAARPVARYVNPAGTALFTLTCDRATGTVSLGLAGPGDTLTIRTTSTVRTVPVRALPGPEPMTPPTIVATLAATDPLLDAMAFSRGRFTAERAGRPPLVLPAWAEVGRVIEDCRRPR